MLKTLFRKINTKISAHKSVVGILGCNFANIYLDEITKRSSNKIQILEMATNTSFNEVNFDIRNELFKICDDIDGFDKFFFHSSKYLFPKVFIENFQPSLKSYSFSLNKLRDLKYIVTEAWLSSTYINFFRAVAFEKEKLKHFIMNITVYFILLWVLWINLCQK